MIICKNCKIKVIIHGHNQKYCIDCQQKLKKEYINNYRTNKKYEEDYNINFENILKYCNNFTPIEFDKYSKISAHSYTSFFKKHWCEILKDYGILELLYNFIVKEFQKYCVENKSYNLQKFANENEYLSESIIRYFNYKQIKIDANILNGGKYSFNDLKDNFFNVINILNRYPKYVEFEKLSKISPTCYQTCYNLPNCNLDEIAKLYLNEEQMKEFYYQKEQELCERNKYAGQISADKREISQEEKDKEFHKVFQDYFNKYKVYPSRRTFYRLSKYSDKLYIGNNKSKNKKKWLDVVKDYGYPINKSGSSEEKECLTLISEILQEEYEPQKSWNWLIGTKGGKMRCDGYFEKYNFIIEYDGIAHSKPVKNFGGYERFAYRQANDKLKDKLIPEHGIKLLRISSKSNWYNKNFLIEQLKLIGIEIPNIPNIPNAS